jgi:hypothetical protein
MPPKLHHDGPFKQVYPCRAICYFGGISAGFRPDVRQQARDRALLPTSVGQSPRTAVAADADSGHRKGTFRDAPSGDRQGRHSDRAPQQNVEKTKRPAVFISLAGGGANQWFR